MNSHEAKPLHLRALLAGSSVFITTLICGFGVMSWFWSRADQGIERGFTYFISATWGDALFLPSLLAGAIAYIVLSSAGPVPQATPVWQRRASWLFGIVGSLVGLGIQASWLMSDKTLLNWTIPELHTFNAAGYYHAFFFVVMMGAIPLLVSTVLIRKPVVEQEGPQLTYCHYSDLAYSIMWFGGSGYAFMRLAENETIRFDNPSMVVVTMLAMTAIGVFCSTIPHAMRHFKGTGSSIMPIFSKDLRLVITGILLAYGVSITVIGIDVGDIENHRSIVLFASALALYCLGLLYPLAQPLERTATICFILASAGLGMGSLLAASSEVSARIIAAIVAVPAIFFVSGYQYDRRIFDQAASGNIVRVWEGLPLTLPALALGVIAQEKARETLTKAVGIEGTNQVIDFVVYFALLGLTVNAMKELFKRCAIEGDSLIPLEQRIRVQNAKNTMWIAFSGMLTGLVVLLLVILVPIEPHNTQIPKQSFSTNTFAAVAMLLVLLILRSANHRQSAAWRITALIGVTLLYGATALFIGGFRLPWLYSAWELLLFFPIIGSALFVGNGVIGNMCLLRGTKPDKWNRSLFIVVFLGCVTVFVFSVLPTFSDDRAYLSSFTSPAIGLGGCLFGAIVPALLGSHALRTDLPKEAILKSTGLRGVLQDALMASATVICAGLFVIHALIYKPGYAITLLCLVIALVAIPAVMFTFSNNYTHLTSEHSTRGVFLEATGNGYSETEVRLQQRALKRHLERQPWIVFIALLPWSLFFFGFALKPFMSAYNQRHNQTKEFNEAEFDHSGVSLFQDCLYNSFLIETSLRQGKNSKYLDRKLGISVDKQTSVQSDKRPWIIALFSLKD